MEVIEEGGMFEVMVPDGLSEEKRKQVIKILKQINKIFTIKKKNHDRGATFKTKI
jgi:hypothetical protein